VTVVRWGIIGCGDVTEVKSGPGLQKAAGSALQAVMRRDSAKAQDYARRHGVPRVHATAGDLIDDPEIDAVYVATHPASHCELALRVAAARKPCLVEKPMAMTHAECLRMNAAFEAAGTPLWVAYYRRALPRFVMIRDLLRQEDLGGVTSIAIELREPLAGGETARTWRFDRDVAGAGLFFDKGSHTIDLLDFFAGPVEDACGMAGNTGGAYAVEDVVAATLRLRGGALATGLWNFNSGVASDLFVVTAAHGEIRTSVFSDSDVAVTRGGATVVHPVRNPPHVHQPLIQTIVDEIAGRGRCESTGASGARAAWVMEQIIGQRATARR
jgi:1,5-anhydro-D-fructose reductase (1,5-anhydro-D-mannitol-forming)